MKPPRSLGRFALVGVAATLIHIGLAWLGLQVLGLGTAAANGLAFVVANLASYACNTLWTFAARPAVGNGARYVGVSLAALALTLAIAVGVERAGGTDALGVAMVVMVVPGFSYAAHRAYTFRGAR